ncbi:serine protease, trypsin family [Renibacterium salmoninarum ATCC 33209]|uniref:Serine protease, trypsin family n=1 Tax=Renibacterium salmoninarum (strain ATCC 33209 / DSM 20767 / JCM 11484 / NBRC 15589 / NCIMB 2235) TaxID=288705 RepID=A9WPN5_RENSM|nr:serine protease, trypsin family [Renibacterium salmoninarum ATCC 33209]
MALVELAQPTDTPTATLGSTTPSIGAKGNIYGWGRETPTGPASPVLKTASVKVTGYGSDNAGGPSVRFNGISGSCWKGDSGGPLIVGGKVVGVASTSSNGGSNPQGACDYVDVAKGLSWIKDVAGL